MAAERQGEDPPVHEDAAERLRALEARVRHELDCLNRPPANWVPPRRRGVERVHDVVIIGGGMCGLVAWHALWTGGVRDVRLLDRAAAGREGPWLDYARMETLRSPKQLVGPALGIASLTCRAWYGARFGEAAWEALDKIPRTTWMAYLSWYARVLEAPVENRVEVTRVEGEEGLLRLTLAGEGADERSILARKLVMATGRDGTGHPNIPAFAASLPRSRWAHTADDIDFAALAGQRVALVGVGASAVDNAAEALEAGAAEVRFLIRRERMPTINKMMGIGSFGFTAGYARLPDEWRWRFMHYSFATQTPPPHGSTRRVSRHENAFFHFGRSIERIVTNETDSGATSLRGAPSVSPSSARADVARGSAPEPLLVQFDDGAVLETDFVILGTGFRTDPAARTELGEAAGEILLWRDAYTPPDEERDEELGRFPYLASDFSFRERRPGAAPWLGDVHCFNYGAAASMGKVSGDIPGISEGASWLARDIAATLYREDIETHWQNFQAYDKPELQGDEWSASELPDRGGDRASTRRVSGAR